VTTTSTSRTSSESLLIVTPTLGNSPFLAATIASVRSQRHRLKHVLVCPPGEATRLRERYPDLMVVCERPNGGLYGAINDALHAAGPWDWFSYINDDDLLLPSFSDMFSDHLEAGVEDIAYGNVRYIDEASNSLGVIPVATRDRHFISLFRQGITPLTQQGTIVPRLLYDRLGLRADFRLCADHDLWVRAAIAGARFRHYRHEVAAYRLTRGQLSRDQVAMKAELHRINQVLPPATGLGLGDRFVRFSFRVRNWRRYWDRIRATGLVTASHMFSTSPMRR
jgi:glycosyltransferase involved in cell wall biosynthesis